MNLKNLMEDEVHDIIESLEGQVEGCLCEKCRLDIAAIALNNLQPEYVVTDIGSVYGRINNLTLQFNSDVLIAVTKAFEIVSKNPKHN